MSCWSTRRSAAARRCCGPRSKGCDAANSSRRNSSRTSPSVITSFPTTTAIRSSTAPPLKQTKARVRYGTRISKRLSDRKKELKVADMLDTGSGGVGQELLVRAAQTIKRRGIDAIGQIQAHRTEGRLVTNAKAGCMDHVVEIRQAVLMDTERDITEAGIDIPHVMKQHPSDVVSNQRESQLSGMEQDGVAADRETGH